MYHKAMRWRFAVMAVLSAFTTAAAGAPKKAVTTPGANLLATVPIRPGYYVDASEKCSSPMTVMKFQPNSVWTIHGDGTRHEQKFVSVTRQGAEYALNFPRPRGGWDEQDPQAMMVQPQGPGRIDVTIQDTASMQHCATEQIPAKFRR